MVERNGERLSEMNACLNKPASTFLCGQGKQKGGVSQAWPVQVSAAAGHLGAVCKKIHWQLLNTEQSQHGGSSGSASQKGQTHVTWPSSSKNYSKTQKCAAPPPWGGLGFSFICSPFHSPSQKTHTASHPGEEE